MTTYRPKVEYAAMLPESWRGMPVSGYSRVRPPTRSDKYRRLRQDARRLARRFNGDLAKLALDRSVVAHRVEVVAGEVIDRLAREVGIDTRKNRVKGLCDIRRDGTVVIRLRDDLSKVERNNVLVHEIGHLRASKLVGDSSERAADTWAYAWRHEAVKERYDLK